VIVERPRTRVSVIEGRTVLVVEKSPAIAPTLELLLAGGRDATGRLWRPLTVSERHPLVLSGTRSACVAEQDHRLRDWLAGVLVDVSGVLRSVRLRACADCGAVEVRDVSLDTDKAHDPAGRGFARRPGLPWRHRDLVIGWYAGSRARGRTFTYMGGTHLGRHR
jgi:hypothetical protein